MQIFPPNNGRGGSTGPGYQTLEAPTESLEQQPPKCWKGVFSISSYTQYFSVDTNVVINRMISSLYPTIGDVFSKINANPDLYGHIWITTTLVFMLSSFGNFATYLMQKHTDATASWSFDVGYVNVAASGICGYAIVVPMEFYFLLQYLGLKASPVRFWCMWGYSLSIFIPTVFLLLIPVEFLRWMIILIAGTVSACFVYLNLRSYIDGGCCLLVANGPCSLHQGLVLSLNHTKSSYMV
ncbi:Pyrroline-5-carboxylate synthetase isoform 1 [Hibiscus syriacus]|uniref:Protein YIP n=1 Tax=Hibiscus syriacus TaxID=106335 RepID=A0A6A3BRI9_HIBSY|nr:Pyrroline-5-carboxylate synthetase isoform 1 [Hibiscus syriacus]